MEATCALRGRSRTTTSAAANGWIRLRAARRRGNETIDDRVDASRITRRDGDARAADAFLRKPLRERLPRLAAVGRLEDPAARSVRRRIRVPRRPPRIPETRVNDVRVPRIDDDFHRADIAVGTEHFLPRRAAVARAIDAAIGTRRVEVTHRRNEDDVRIPRIDRDFADVLRGVE